MQLQPRNVLTSIEHCQEYWSFGYDSTNSDISPIDRKSIKVLMIPEGCTDIELGPINPHITMACASYDAIIFPTTLERVDRIDPQIPTKRIIFQSPVTLKTLAFSNHPELEEVIILGGFKKLPCSYSEFATNRDYELGKMQRQFLDCHNLKRLIVVDPVAGLEQSIDVANDGDPMQKGALKYNLENGTHRVVETSTISQKQLIAYLSSIDISSEFIPDLPIFRKSKQRKLGK